MASPVTQSKIPLFDQQLFDAKYKAAKAQMDELSHEFYTAHDNVALTRKTNCISAGRIGHVTRDEESYRREVHTEYEAQLKRHEAKFALCSIAFDKAINNVEQILKTHPLYRKGF
jgi:hypothetical protein